MSAIDRLREAVKMSESYPATIVRASEVTPLLEAYDEALRQLGHWHDEALRYCANADYWRQQAEAADHEGATCD